MGKIALEVSATIIIFVSVLYYIAKLSQYKESDRGQRVLAYASQITFSAFILGFAVILIYINTIGLPRGKFVLAILFHATFVCVVNMISIMFYNKTI